MSYFSEEEVRRSASRCAKGLSVRRAASRHRLVRKDWVCEWEFSKERFPICGVHEGHAEQGYVYRCGNAHIGKGNKLLDLAREKRYLAPLKTEASARIRFPPPRAMPGRSISIPRPPSGTRACWSACCAWEQRRSDRLWREVDRGETITECRRPSSTTSMRCCTSARLGDHPGDDGRASSGRRGWAGCQRYPLHWGGDSAARGTGWRVRFAAACTLACRGMLFEP